MGQSANIMDGRIANVRTDGCLRLHNSRIYNYFRVFYCSWASTIRIIFSTIHILGRNIF